MNKAQILKQVPHEKGENTRKRGERTRSPEKGEIFGFSNAFLRTTQIDNKKITR
jgi:hypothetical protein